MKKPKFQHWYYFFQISEHVNLNLTTLIFTSNCHYRCDVITSTWLKGCQSSSKFRIENLRPCFDCSDQLIAQEVGKVFDKDVQMSLQNEQLPELPIVIWSLFLCFANWVIIANRREQKQMKNGLLLFAQALSPNFGTQCSVLTFFLKIKFEVIIKTYFELKSQKKIWEPWNIAERLCWVIKQAITVEASLI